MIAFHAAVWAVTVQPRLPDPHAYELRWQAPVACPSEFDVTQAVDRALGSWATPSDRPTVHTTVVIERDDAGRFRMELVLNDGTDGRRELYAIDCGELADAAALMIAIAVDPDILARASAPRVVVPPRANEIVPEPAPTPSKSTRDDSPERLQRKATPMARTPSHPLRKRQRPHSSGRILAGPGLVLLGTTTALVEVAFGLFGRHWRGEIGAVYWVPRELRAAADSRVGGRFQLGAAVVRGCGVPNVGSVALPLCVSLDVGGLRSDGVGELDATTRILPWVALRSGPHIRWRVRKMLALWLGGEVVVPLVRAQFQANRTLEVHQVPPIAGVVLAGLELATR